MGLGGAGGIGLQRIIGCCAVNVLQYNLFRNHKLWIQIYWRTIAALLRNQLHCYRCTWAAVAVVIGEAGAGGSVAMAAAGGWVVMAAPAGEAAVAAKAREGKEQEAVVVEMAVVAAASGWVAALGSVALGALGCNTSEIACSVRCCEFDQKA